MAGLARRATTPVNASVLRAAASIRLLVLDFDGVMTDNRVLVDQDGREAVWCSRGDGMGIGLLRGAGVEVMVVSKETNKVVSARCKKLHIEAVQGIDDKLTVLRHIAKDRGLKPKDIAYTGNDVNDLECMQWVGLPIAVADSEAAILPHAAWVTRRNGGYGAVRDVCDLLIAARAGK